MQVKDDEGRGRNVLSIFLFASRIASWQLKKDLVPLGGLRLSNHGQAGLLAAVDVNVHNWGNPTNGVAPNSPCTLQSPFCSRLLCFRPLSSSSATWPVVGACQAQLADGSLQKREQRRTLRPSWSHTRSQGCLYFSCIFAFCAFCRSRPPISDCEDILTTQEPRVRAPTPQKSAKIVFHAVPFLQQRL